MRTTEVKPSSPCLSEDPLQNDEVRVSVTVHVAGVCHSVAKEIPNERRLVDNRRLENEVGDTVWIWSSEKDVGSPSGVPRRIWANSWGSDDEVTVSITIDVPDK